MRPLATILIASLIALFSIAVHAQETETRIYDNTGKLRQRWIQQGDRTTVMDDTNKITGYRYRQGDRIEIQDNTHKITGYEYTE